MSRTENKTQATDADVTAFLEAVQHPTRRADALALDALFRRVSGYDPRLWGSSLVGYGRYDYTYTSGRQGSFLATGFSPRKASLSIYIMPGYADYGEMLARLGKHRKAVSCLYVNKLADIDLSVLEDIIRTGLRDLNARWPVYPG